MRLRNINVLDDLDVLVVAIAAVSAGVVGTSHREAGALLSGALRYG